MTNPRALFESSMHFEMPEVVREWCSPEKIARDIDERLQLEFERCVDETFAEEFARACPVEGCEPADYAQRITSSGDQTLLTGIRFKGGSVEFPFVDLIASQKPLDDESSMESALEHIREEYVEFAPRAVRLMRSTNKPVSLPKHIASEVDQYIVIGPVEALATSPQPTVPVDIRLENVRDIDEAERFVAASYQTYIDEYPIFETVIFAASTEDLSRCSETGILAWVKVNAKRAGIIATAAELGPLVRGQTVVEEVLSGEFRGRGLGVLAQGLLIKHLHERELSELVCGTIDARNLASRATARRVGRREVAAWHWLRWK